MKSVSLVFLCVYFITLCCGEGKEDEGYYTNSWAVEILGGDDVANRIAETHGFINKGQIGNLNGLYHFVHSESPSRSTRSFDHKHKVLLSEEEVTFVEQQVAKKRVKRNHLVFHDPWWSKQWYLHRKYLDMNVQPVWDQGITGKGVVVSIIDDGIEYTHPDLRHNYDPHASYDFNGNDSDPIPRYDPSNENRHGTRCAGEVAAGLNNVCTVGVAYNASIGGVRMLDGDVTDVVEASSLSLNSQHIDIYSSSWGPTDNGRTLDGPGKLTKHVFMNGISKGRGGKGSIYVWASGNGGASKDSCSCDGYVVSPYTIAISAVTQHNQFPWYAEECSSILAATYSSGSRGEKQIITTDLRHKCADHHTGTSAAAPMAAGLLALALEANSHLTWRDVQYIIIYSSNSSIPIDPHWQVNGAGLRVSHKYGFGLMDAAALVNRARYWINVQEQRVCNISVTLGSVQRTAIYGSPLEITINLSKQNCPSIGYLEHIQAIITATVNGKRGNVRISLRSPKGTLSTLLQPRKHDNHNKGFNHWPFMTVMSWGEEPHGDWLLKMSVGRRTKVQLDSLSLIFYGVDSQPEAVKYIHKKCSSQCASGCSRSGSKYCDTCKHLRDMSTFKCVDKCPPHTYLSGTMCYTCPTYCTACTNRTTCTQCIQGASLSPRSGCCPDNCTRCANDRCIECQTGLVLTPSMLCQLTCPPTYYISNGICVLNFSSNYRPLESSDLTSSNLLMPLHATVSAVSYHSPLSNDFFHPSHFVMMYMFIIPFACLVVISFVVGLIVFVYWNRKRFAAAVRKSRVQYTVLYSSDEIRFVSGMPVNTNKDLYKVYNKASVSLDDNSDDESEDEIYTYAK